MKASYNRKNGEVTLKMSVADYLNLQRTMRNINGSGEGFIKAEQHKKCKTLCTVTTLVFIDEIMTALMLPKLQFGQDGRPTFKKGGK